jgi:F-type H+-transporting ATPase subunit b
VQIDWFTLVAQIVNFLILLALLKRFLYGPIVRAMERREQKIAGYMQEAREKVRIAEQESDRYRQLQQALVEQREAAIAQMKAEVEQMREVLLQNVREEVNARQSRWQEAIQRQQSAFLRELRYRALQEIYAAIRQALRDLADADLEQQAIAVFLRRIQKLTGEERQALCSVASPRNHNAPEVMVASSFALPEDSRQAITQVLREQLPNDVRLRFETTEDLICGIELRSAGCKLAWSLENYLASLENSLSAVFAQETGKSTT